MMKQMILMGLILVLGFAWWLRRSSNKRAR